MVRHMNQIAAALCLLILPAVACDGHDHDHGDGDAHLFCQGDEEAITANMSKTGTMNNFKVHILSWNPDPLVVGNNVFNIRVTDTSDTAIDGISFDVTETWARVHDHGTPVTPTVTAGSGTGEFEIKDMNVVHTGSWLFRFGPNNGTLSDFVEFNFGIQCPPDPS